MEMGEGTDVERRGQTDSLVIGQLQTPRELDSSGSDRLHQIFVAQQEFLIH